MLTVSEGSWTLRKIVTKCSHSKNVFFLHFGKLFQLVLVFILRFKYKDLNLAEIVEILNFRPEIFWKLESTILWIFTKLRKFISTHFREKNPFKSLIQIFTTFFNFPVNIIHFLTICLRLYRYCNKSDYSINGNYRKKG